MEKLQLLYDAITKFTADSEYDPEFHVDHWTAYLHPATLRDLADLKVRAPDIPVYYGSMRYVCVEFMPQDLIVLQHIHAVVGCLQLGVSVDGLFVEVAG